MRSTFADSRVVSLYTFRRYGRTRQNAHIGCCQSSTRGGIRWYLIRAATELTPGHPKCISRAHSSPSLYPSSTYFMSDPSFFLLLWLLPILSSLVNRLPSLLVALIAHSFCLASTRVSLSPSSSQCLPPCLRCFDVVVDLGHHSTLGPLTTPRLSLAEADRRHIRTGPICRLDWRGPRWLLEWWFGMSPWSVSNPYPWPEQSWLSFSRWSLMTSITAYTWRAWSSW